jgi:tetratricopeptide (TPR) repeat protein
MDTNNPVVKLCAAGMQAEAEGRPDEARRLFNQAWAASQDDYDRCVAAHFVARHQDSPPEMLRWNLEALARAEAAGDERVRSFYPSLYLNLGYAYETLGNQAEAKRHYQLAAEKMDGLPPGPYGDVVRDGVVRGLGRVSSS